MILTKNDNFGTTALLVGFQLQIGAPQKVNLFPKFYIRPWCEAYRTQLKTGFPVFWRK